MDCCYTLTSTNTFDGYSYRLTFLNFIGCFFHLKHTLACIVEGVNTFSCNGFASFIDKFDSMFTRSQVICFIDHLATFTSCILGLNICNFLTIHINRHFPVVWIDGRNNICFCSCEAVSYASVFLVGPHRCSTDTFRFIIPSCIFFIGCGI